MLAHRFAKLVAFAPFVLLVIGGTVNPTGSSLACPEPTFVCNGQLFPPMVGGVFYEHGHRLAAMTVGLLQIGLTLLLLLDRRRLGALLLPFYAPHKLVREIRASHSPDKGLAIVLLLMVILQGVLGAITVKYKLPWFVSTAHLVLAMSYFAALVYTAFRVRPAPSVVELEQHERRRRELGRARRWIVIAVVAVAIQLVLGALVRHLGAAMVCLGWPTCTIAGDWWPAAEVQHLHMIHRGFGFVVGGVTSIAAIQVWRAARSWPGLRTLAMVAPVLVVAQIVLGVYTVLTMREVPIAVAHFAGAASLWALWMSALLMTRPRTAATAVAIEPRPVLPRAAVLT